MKKVFKTGLVLSGGGAKGAYHVGVVKALAEYGIELDCIAGASIGALNGSILASSHSMRQGYERLNQVWQVLSQQSPIKVQTKQFFIPAYLILLASFGLRLNSPQYMIYRGISGVLRSFNLESQFFKEIEEKLHGKEGILDNAPLTALLNQYLTWQDLQQGIPLHVSAYRSRGGLLDIASCIAAELDLKDTAPSEFFCLQQLSEQEWKSALMASAALPILYESQKIGQNTYTDGGQGGWKTAQGNTPITPLVQSGCHLVIVSHLSEGSFWNRHDFPNTTVVEIRPQKNISRDGIKDLLAFNPDRIDDWIEQGYEDTMACIGTIKSALDNRHQLVTTIQQQQNEQQKMLDSSERMQAAMARIRRS